MSVFNQIVGGVILLTACIGLICWWTSIAAGKMKSVLDMAIQEGRDSERTRISQAMARESYWFSENLAAQTALELYAQGLVTGAYTSAIRDAWRQSTSQKLAQEES